MTLTIARFDALIANARDDDYVIQGPKGSLSIVTSEQWAQEKWEQQPGKWKAAKQEFIDFLDREWGEGAYKLLPQRPQEGRPLEVREVRWMIEHDEVRKRHPQPPPVPALPLSTPLAHDTNNVFVDPTDEIAKMLPKSPKPARCAPDEIPQLDIDEFDRDFGELQRQLAEWPTSFTSGEKRIAGSHALVSPATPITEMELISQLPAAPLGNHIIRPAPVPIDRSVKAAPKGGFGAHREQQNNGPKGKEHEVEPKNADPGNPAKILQDKAWKDFNRVFKAAIEHAAKKEEDGAAKAKEGVGAALRAKFSGSKKAAGETEDTEAPGTEKQFQLTAGERIFADLFVKPPKLDELDKLLAKKEVATKNPLSVYFDLPKTMDNWLFRMRNAKIKLDTVEVINEIDATFKDLRKDIKAIKNFDDSNLTKEERDHLIKVKAQLSSIYDFNIEETAGGPLFKGTLLSGLRLRCLELLDLLPEDPPKIDDGHHYLAFRALTKMGIEVSPNTNTKLLVDMANRMREAHNTLRRGLSQGETWQSIHDNASESEKEKLEEYRQKRINGIRQQVNSETGVTIELVDRENGNKGYYLVTDDSWAEEQARYRLSTIAFAMGGYHRELFDVFGYEERYLAELAKERAEKQAATA